MRIVRDRSLSLSSIQIHTDNIEYAQEFLAATAKTQMLNKQLVKSNKNAVKNHRLKFIFNEPAMKDNENEEENQM